MGEFRPPRRTDWSRNPGEKWYECVLCGPKRVTAIVEIDRAIGGPTVGETITGATSGHTGIVEKVYPMLTVPHRYGESAYGTYSYGGCERKKVILSSATGHDDINLEIFQNGEYLNGTISGVSFSVVNGLGSIQISGRLVPDSNIIEYHGKHYCRAHFLFLFGHEWLDDAKVDTATEGDRE